MKLYFIYALFLFSIAFPRKAYTQLRLTAYSGFFNQNFNWSVAGNYAGQNPNIYSELKWDKLKGQASGIEAEYRFPKKIVVSSLLSYASIKSGIITDADYKGDNRTDRSYYAQYNSGNSYLFVSSISAGYILLNKKKFTFTTLIGYSYQKEKLKIVPGKYDSSIISTGLNSSYIVSISGPQVSGVLQYVITHNLSVNLSIQFQLINYESNADWNLATNFQHPVSFRQLAIGSVFNSEFKIGYAFNKHLGAKICIRNEDLKTNGGDDVLYKSSGEVLISHFNGAKGNSFYAVIGITYQR